MSKVKLLAENVEKFFSDPQGCSLVEVLQRINLEVKEGEFVSLLGPSGCGKTTFLRMVDGLLLPSKGKIYLDGKEVKGPSLDRGFVFQRGALFPWRTALNNVIFGLEIKGVSRKEAVEIGQRLIKMIGLTGFENAYPYQLSGGMQQRVALARALAIDPAILLMDEPFAALDAQTREIMQQELLQIWEKNNKTVLFVTHQIDEAIFLSDRVIVFSGRPGQIKSILEIDFPRPRDLGIKRTVEFMEIADTIWRQIEEEVRRSIA